MNPVTLQSAAEGVFRASWQASALAVLILGIQLSLGRRISARARYGLWSLVLMRLAVPFNVPSPVSVHNFYSRKAVEIPPVMLAPISLRAPAVRTDTTVVTAPPGMTWPQRLGVAWLVGCGVSSIMVLAGSIRLSRHVRRQRAVKDQRVLALLRSCATELGVRHLPALLTGPDAGGPALVGFVKPRLLLPESVLRFEDEALRLILLHELAHQKRRDVPANWALAALQSAHWFNPVVHLVFARVRADRELACDERVLSLSKSADRPTYGRTIVRLVESLSDTPRTPALAVGILEGRHQLRRRITMIAEHRPVRRTWSLVALVLASVVAAVACTDAVGGQKPAAGSQGTLTVTGGRGTLAVAPPAATPGAEGELALAQPADDRLLKRLPELKLEGIPLSDALDFVRDAAKVNLFVDRKALEAAGVELDAPVTLSLKDITVEQAFRLIGKAAAPTGVELGANADGDVIVFSVTAQTGAAQPVVPGGPFGGGGRAPGFGDFGGSPSISRRGARRAGGRAGV
jgi:beta-lactamase regulating signal transducer with metallopeptidase domain